MTIEYLIRTIIIIRYCRSKLTKREAWPMPNLADPVKLPLKLKSVSDRWANPTRNQDPYSWEVVKPHPSPLESLDRARVRSADDSSKLNWSWWYKLISLLNFSMTIDMVFPTMVRLNQPQELRNRSNNTANKHRLFSRRYAISKRDPRQRPKTLNQQWAAQSLKQDSPSNLFVSTTCFI